MEGGWKEEKGPEEKSTHDAGLVTAWVHPWAALELEWPVRVIPALAEMAGPFYLPSSATIWPKMSMTLGSSTAKAILKVADSRGLSADSTSSIWGKKSSTDGWSG